MINKVRNGRFIRDIGYIIALPLNSLSNYPQYCSLMEAITLCFAPNA